MGEWEGIPSVASVFFLAVRKTPKKTMTVDEDAIEAVTQLGGLVSAKGRTERKIGNRGSAVTSRF